MQSENESQFVPIEEHKRIVRWLINDFVEALRAQMDPRLLGERQGLRRDEPSAMSVDEVEQHVQRAGGVQEIAKSIGVNHMTVWNWRWGKHRMRPKHAEMIRALPDKPSRPRGRQKNPCVLPPDEVKSLCQTLGGIRAAARMTGLASSTLSQAANGRLNLSADRAKKLQATATKAVDQTVAGAP